ncbi:hypothetical protein GGR56DRAFT_264028 [Xylariaceae sp. FL0804]|nr:hypothetical protein GGR56DRAFT_264028 [Xylariaceae sp. FL0804]
MSSGPAIQSDVGPLRRIGSLPMPPPAAMPSPWHASPLRNPASMLMAVILLISCGPLAAAISLANPPPPTETALLIDTRIPVLVNGQWQIMSDEEHRQLRGRGAAGTPTLTIDTRTTYATTDESPLPSPFDGALASNFSNNNGCSAFINSFLSNTTFRECYPVSILLQSSTSFFEAEKSAFSITRTLNHACAADVDSCTTFLSALGDELVDSANCGEDFQQQNALVVQAYTGMKVYNTVYKATCLTDESDSSNYCFANAVTNATTASNSYLYYLPFNSSLPSNAAPACDQCNLDTMAIYQAATSDRDADISSTYESAAKQIDSLCGSGFVNTTLAASVPDNSVGALRVPPSSLFAFSLLFTTLLHWIL